ncbi:MAG: UDP-3-O-(3-hydroxymyristoyl)glucosamine N-acyltransferase [Saprospiraceae bacterium]
MKFDQPFTAQLIAEMCNADILGDPSTLLNGMNEIHKVISGDLMFVDNEKYFQKSIDSMATGILINKKIQVPVGKVLLFHESPFDAYNALAWHFRPFLHITSAISPFAMIDPSATIEPGVVIAPYVRIGEGSYIQANSYIGSYTQIGKEVIIQPNCIIGSDAFYYNKKHGVHHKWRSIGRVIIEDYVEIGAGSTIVRGVSGDTVLGEGTKLDCQVHVGHGVRIGKHNILAAHTSVGGKVIIGDHVTIYGQVGIAQNVKIGDHAVLLAKTGVDKDLEGGITYYGVPAQPARAAFKQIATLRMLTNDHTKKSE